LKRQTDRQTDRQKNRSLFWPLSLSLELQKIVEEVDRYIATDPDPDPICGFVKKNISALSCAVFDIYYFQKKKHGLSVVREEEEDEEEEDFSVKERRNHDER
jgi:hypothetical protein